MIIMPQIKREKYGFRVQGFNILGDRYCEGAKRLKQFRPLFHPLLVDAGLPSVFAVQGGLRRGNRIPAANPNIPIEVHFSGREDYQNGEK